MKEEQFDVENCIENIAKPLVCSIEKTQKEIEAGTYVEPHKREKKEIEPLSLNTCNCGLSPKLIKGENRDGYGLLGELHWIECKCGMKTKKSYERDGKNNGSELNKGYITEIVSLWNRLNTYDERSREFSKNHPHERL